MDLTEWIPEFTRRDWETSTDGTVRFAVIGLGGFARDWSLPAFAETDYCRATVAVSGSPEKARRVADEFDLEHGITYDEFHDGVAADAYDAVYVVTPHAYHREYIETAADLGKAVLCEKAMAATVEGAEAIAETVEATDTTFMLAYRMQLGPAVRRMRELIREGFVGDPVHVNSNFSVTMLEDPSEDADQWRLDEDVSGGGALVDLGLYPLNTTRFLLDADPTAVYASTSSPDAAFADVDEHIAFQLEFSDGVHAVCTASYNAHGSSHLTVTGTEGRLKLEPAFYEQKPQQVELTRDGVTTTVDLGSVNHLVEQFDYFAHCLLTDTAPEADEAHGLVDMRLVEALYESAETGTRVDC